MLWWISAIALAVSSAFGLRLREEILWPEGLHVPSGEASANQGRPVCVDEAEHAAKWRIASEGFANDSDLSEHPVDALGAVAGADEQALDSRAEEDPFDLEVRATAVPLGMDHLGAVVVWGRDKPPEQRLAELHESEDRH